MLMSADEEYVVNFAPIFLDPIGVVVTKVMPLTLMDANVMVSAHFCLHDYQHKVKLSFNSLPHNADF